MLVAGLIGLCALALKWLSDKSLLVRHMGTGKRLKLIESTALDAKHRMFIIECDDKEHVLVSTGSQVVVVESKEKVVQNG